MTHQTISTCTHYLIFYTFKIHNRIKMCTSTYGICTNNIVIEYSTAFGCMHSDLLLHNWCFLIFRLVSKAYHTNNKNPSRAPMFFLLLFNFIFFISKEIKETLIPRFWFEQENEYISFYILLIIFIFYIRPDTTSHCIDSLPSAPQCTYWENPSSFFIITCCCVILK